MYGHLQRVRVQSEKVELTYFAAVECSAVVIPVLHCGCEVVGVCLHR
jgi:hypothetical protein